MSIRKHVRWNGKENEGFALLSESKVAQNCILLKRKDAGGLLYPSDNVITVRRTLSSVSCGSIWQIIDTTTKHAPSFTDGCYREDTASKFVLW
jgi:hypothetical protein